MSILCLTGPLRADTSSRIDPAIQIAGFKMIKSTYRQGSVCFHFVLCISIFAMVPCANPAVQAQSDVGDDKSKEQTRVAQGFFEANVEADSPFQTPAKHKTVATNLRQFGVPFQINAADESFIEVQLYLSRDQGKTWRFQGRQATDQREFPFQAQADGEYWFALKTLNRDRKLVPDGEPAVDLSIIVDTVKPELDFRIETDAAGRVVCRWRATDKNLAPNTMRILYQPVGINGPAQSWTQVPIQLAGTARGGVYADQLAWWPETTERNLNVAVEIKDIAGNAVQLTRQILIAQTGWKHKSRSTAQITDAQNPATQNNGWATPKSTTGQNTTGIQANLQTHQNREQASSPGSAHPSNDFICKDGVCKPIIQSTTQADSQPNRVAKLTNANQWNFDPAKSRARLPNAVAAVPSQAAGFESGAPPVPPGYVPAQNELAHLGLGQPQPMATVPNASPNGPQVWQSDVENWVPKNQTSIASTMHPDPAVAPRPFPNPLPRQSVTKVPSNAATMVHQGDKVIGQSSTMGATNQYRGLNSQNNQPIPKSTLLPGVAGIQPNPTHPDQPSTNRQPSSRRTVNRPIDERANARSSGAGSFSQAGFGQPGTAKDVMPRRTTDAPIQIIGSKRFRLNYGIDSIDPSGVARVDLWLTRDGGRSWQAWGSDPDNHSPFPVEIQEEGRYGFRIVVHSKDGLTGQGPSSGDDADMWVLVDTQSPMVRITSVPYGRGHEAGRLVINYSVSDKFLTLRPIALAYSQNPQGPWNSIGEGLRNEGRFVWKPTPDVPDRIFLRIDALDKAGNIGVHLLSQAIDVSGLVPRGTIHGVVPVGERSPRQVQSQN